MKYLKAKIKTKIRNFLVATGPAVLTSRFLVFPSAWVVADRFPKEPGFLED